MTRSPQPAHAVGFDPAVRLFNDLPADAAADLLRQCADVPRWAQEVQALRPFSGTEAVIASASARAAEWTDAEVSGALRAHPRIGGTGGASEQSASLSRREQSGVRPEDAERWQRANSAYEQRFGEKFLIRASGRDSAQMLAEMARRMALDPAAERLERREQLRQIAVGRLRAQLSALGEKEAAR